MVCLVPLQRQAKPPLGLWVQAPFVLSHDLHGLPAVVNLIRVMRRMTQIRKRRISMEPIFSNLALNLSIERKKKEEYIVSAKNSRWGRGDNIVLEWAMIILHTLTVYTQCKVWTFLKIWISSFAKCGHFVTSVYQGMLKKNLF